MDKISKRKGVKDKMKYDVVAFGENLIDFVPAKEQTEDKLAFSGFPGGAPANVLACVARLGGKTSFITWRILSRCLKKRSNF